MGYFSVIIVAFNVCPEGRVSIRTLPYNKVTKTIHEMYHFEYWAHVHCWCLIKLFAKVNGQPTNLHV